MLEVRYLHHSLLTGGILSLQAKIPMSTSGTTVTQMEPCPIRQREYGLMSAFSPAMHRLQYLGLAWNLKTHPHLLLKRLHLIGSLSAAWEVQIVDAIITQIHPITPTITPSHFHRLIISRWAMGCSQKFCPGDLQLGRRRSFLLQTHWLCHLLCVNLSTSFWRHLARMQWHPPIHGVWW